MGPFLLLFLVGAFVTSAEENPAVQTPPSLLQRRPTSVKSISKGPHVRGLAETITKPSRVEENGEDDEEGDEDDSSEEGDVEAEGDDEAPPDSDDETTELTTTPPPKKKGKKGANPAPPPKKGKGKKSSTTTTPEPEEDDEDDETPAPPPPPPPKKKGKKKPITTTTPEPDEDDEEEDNNPPPPPPKGKKPKKSAAAPHSDDEEDSGEDADQPPPAPNPGGKKGGKKKGSPPAPTKAPGDDSSSSTSAPKWTPELKAGKFVDFHDIIEYFVQNNHDRTFSGMLVFQIIKFRNGDAAIEKRFIDRLIKCLKPALPELRVLATLRRRMRQGLAGKDRDQARGLAARTVTTAIKHFYYAADEEGIPARLIVGVINAMHTFEQASYSNPLEEKPGSGSGGGESGTGKGNDGFNRSSSRLRDSYLSFEEELERLLDEIESDIMDDYEASLRGQYLPGADTLDDDEAQQDIIDAIGALSVDRASIYAKHPSR